MNAEMLRYSMWPFMKNKQTITGKNLFQKSQLWIKADELLINNHPLFNRGKQINGHH